MIPAKNKQTNKKRNKKAIRFFKFFHKNITGAFKPERVEQGKDIIIGV